MTTLLNTFRDVFTLGLTQIIPDALVILGLLLVIELSWLGLWSALGGELNIVALASKAIGAIIVGYLIEHWAGLTRTLIRVFIAVGLKAGGDAISVTDFTDPGNIALFGIATTATFFAHIMEYSAVDAVKNLPELLLGVPIGLLILVAYFLLAIWIFITQLEFYAHATLTLILLPFGIHSKVAFLAEKAISVIFASAVRLFVLAFITSVTLPVMQRTQVGGGLNPSLKTLTVQLLAAGALVLLAWRADKSAQALVQGAPQLHSADVQQVVRTSVLMATRVGQMVQSVNTLLGLSRTPGNATHGAQAGLAPQRRRP